MNLPQGTREDRRTVPRHLRDSEHDITGDAPATGMRAGDAGDTGRRTRAWVYALLAALVVAMSLWIGLSAV